MLLLSAVDQRFLYVGASSICFSADTFRAVFIRAPAVVETGPNVGTRILFCMRPCCAWQWPVLLRNMDLSSHVM